MAQAEEASGEFIKNQVIPYCDHQALLKHCPTSFLHVVVLDNVTTLLSLCINYQQYLSTLKLQSWPDYQQVYPVSRKILKTALIRISNKCDQMLMEHLRQALTIYSFNQVVRSRQIVFEANFYSLTNCFILNKTKVYIPHVASLCSPIS